MDGMGYEGIMPDCAAVLKLPICLDAAADLNAEQVRLTLRVNFKE